MAIYSPDGIVIFTPTERGQHHPWCNHYMQERGGCKMCEDFYVRFPVGPNMMAKFFPNAVAVTPNPSRRVER